jgi:hypothetical protein
LAAEDFLDESVCVLKGLAEGAAEGAFVAEDAGGDGAEGFAASAAGALVGEDLDEIGEGGEGVGEGVLEGAGGGFFNAGYTGSGFKEVGAADVADEEEVAGDEGDGLVGTAAFVGDEVGEVFGGVAWGVDGAEEDVADAEGIAVVEDGGVGAAFGPAGGPVGGAFTGEVEVDLGVGGELLGAADEVGMDVGFGDGGDLEVVVAGEGEVLLDVAFGIDNDGLAGGFLCGEAAFEDGEIFCAGGMEFFCGLTGAVAGAADDDAFGLDLG